MKKLLVILDDDLAKELEKYPNKSEIVRESLRVYNGHISTDTVAGLRQSYKILVDRLDKLDEDINKRLDELDEPFRKLKELMAIMESRMM